MGTTDRSHGRSLTNGVAMARAHDHRPHGVGRQHQDPAGINPMVVDERPAVGLRPPIIERLDLAVQAPVA